MPPFFPFVVSTSDRSHRQFKRLRPIENFKDKNPKTHNISDISTVFYRKKNFKGLSMMKD